MRLEAWCGPFMQDCVVGFSLYLEAQLGSSYPEPPSLTSPLTLYTVSAYCCSSCPPAPSSGGSKAVSTTDVGMHVSGCGGWRLSLWDAWAGNLPHGAWGVPGWSVLCCCTSPWRTILFPCHVVSAHIIVELLFLGDCGTGCPCLNLWMCFSL